MAYRPSYAGFELNVISPIAGVLPASLQAAAIGSAISLTGFAIVGLGRGDFALSDMSFAVLWGALGIGLMMTLVGTVFCAFYIALFGVPVAWLLRGRLDTPFGLGVAMAIAVAAGAASVGVIVGLAPLGTEHLLLGALISAYALPAGILYRRAVLAARSFSPFVEPERGPAA